MAYLTFAEYHTLGGSCKEATFVRFEATARAHIDRLTHGRVKNETPTREAVKLLSADIIDLLSGSEKGAKSGMQSFSNGVLSATYLSDHQVRTRIAAMARTHLATEVTADGVSLLFAGVAVT